jgi:glycosyltransferase involved in cell wall biosynthesis
MSTISVVIPSYNHARFVAAAIRSVLDQDHSDVELVIIDDGSTDGSPAVIRQTLVKYPGRRITFHQQANAGAHAAISRGLSLATGRCLTILNSDDLFDRDRLGKMLGALPRDGEFIGFSMLRFIDDDDQELGPESGIGRWYHKALHEAALCPTVGYGLLRNNFSVTSGNLVFSRSLYERVGDFAPFRMCHDWDFLMRATHRVEPVFVQEPLISYRVHAANTLHSTQHLLLEEGVPAINRYVELGLKERSPNPLAPGWAHWPVYFDYFINTYSSWFSAEPIRGFLHAVPAATGMPEWKSWMHAKGTGLEDRGLLAGNHASADAAAVLRDMALRETGTMPARPANWWDELLGAPVAPDKAGAATGMTVRKAWRAGNAAVNQLRNLLARESRQNDG